MCKTNAIKMTKQGPGVPGEQAPSMIHAMCNVGHAGVLETTGGVPTEGDAGRGHKTAKKLSK